MSTESQDRTPDQDRPVSLEPEPVESPASPESPESSDEVPEAVNPPLRDPLFNATDPAGTDPF